MSHLVQLICTAAHHSRHDVHRGDPSPDEVARRAAVARARYFARVHDAG